MTLATRLIGMLAMVLMAVILSSVVHGRHVDRVFREARERNAQAHRAVQFALSTQVHFKKQVQEWKNILLRGSDMMDFAKYRRQFDEETVAVRRLTDRLVLDLPEAAAARRAALAFAKAHISLQHAYERALAAFEKDRTNPFPIDALVRGIDREPTDLLDRVVTDVTAWRDKALALEAEQLGRARRRAIAAVSLIMFTAMALSLWALRSWVYRPIMTLDDAAQRLANGELGHQVVVNGDGELGRLADRFNRMSTQLAELVHRVRTQAELEQEMEVAQTVQAALLPAPTVQRLSSLEIVGHYLPASRCGGDWWSYFQLSDHETLVLVGDVTGHGVPTTLITASVNAYCEELFRTTQEFRTLCSLGDHGLTDYADRRATLSYLFEQLNGAVARLGEGRFLMTFSAALVDRQRGQVTFASAGHEVPLMISGDGRILPLYTGPSLRLGESTTAEFAERTHPFRRGDAIVWYTDGLVDATNGDGQAFGDGRLLRTLKHCHGAAVDVVAEGILGNLYGFSGRRDFDDDVTMVIVRWPPSDDDQTGAKHDTAHQRTHALG